MKELCAVIEAILFVSGDPVRVEDLAHSMNLTAMEMETALTELADHLSLESHGLQLNRSGGEVFLSIRPEYAPQVEAFLQPLEKRPLSQAVLETLSIIAYRQPVTKADIEQVRGVDSSSTVSKLMERGLIEEAGRLDLPGKPVAFRVTDTFLRVFGLGSLADLPPLHDDPQKEEELPVQQTLEELQ